MLSEVTLRSPIEEEGTFRLQPEALSDIAGDCDLSPGQGAKTPYMDDSSSPAKLNPIQHATTNWVGLKH